MTAQAMHIVIDVTIDGDEISGHAGDGVGRSRPFSGWLGLIGALDELPASLSSSAAQARVPLCLAFTTATEAQAFAASAALRDAMRHAGVVGAPEIWAAESRRTAGAS